MAKVRSRWRNIGTLLLKKYAMMRTPIIPSKSSHTRRSHNTRNFFDDLRDSLELIRLKKDLDRDDFSRTCGSAVVPFEDPLTLTGSVDSMAERMNMPGMQKKYSTGVSIRKEALGRTDGDG